MIGFENLNKVNLGTSLQKDSDKTKAIAGRPKKTNERLRKIFVFDKVFFERFMKYMYQKHGLRNSAALQYSMKRLIETES